MATCGKLVVEQVGDRSAVTSRLARYPLRFLFFERSGETDSAVQWVYVVTFGGGVVSGDQVAFDVHMLKNAVAVLTTQASTKIFKSVEGKVALQQMRVKVETGALLCVAPDPVTCFQGAKYRQEQFFDLEAGANLVFVDIVSCGRVSGHNEVWAMHTYSNKTEIKVDGRPIFLDDLELHGETTEGQLRMGRVAVFATVVLVGPLVHQIEDLVALQASSGSASSKIDLARTQLIDNSGTVLRILATEVEAIEETLGNLLDGLTGIVGGPLYGNGSKSQRYSK